MGFEIEINSVAYKSIGSYMDNQEGIAAYMPNEGSIEWATFFNTEEPLIVLWTLNYLMHNEQDGSNSDFDSSLVQSVREELERFLKKYYWEFSFSEAFEDFIYGDYARENLMGDFPTIVYEGKLMEHDYFDFDDYVFIKSTEFNQFINDLDAITSLIMYRLNQ
jgi:hypothetical protein